MMNKFDVTVVTVVMNSSSTMQICIDSVKCQKNVSVQHVIVDGCSTDGTIDLIKQYADTTENVVWISEPDDGIYDAMNKGLDLAEGTIVSILNADDHYRDDLTLGRVVEVFSKHIDLDILLTDVDFINDRGAVLRRVKASWFKPKRLKYGWMPPHPGMFITKNAYQRIGQYRTNYKIAADYEFCVRAFLIVNCVHRVKDWVSVNMRDGGVSTSGFSSTKLITKEIIQSLIENSIKPYYILLLLRLPIKLILKKTCKKS